MSRRTSPTDAHDQAVQIINAWTMIPDKTIGQFSRATLEQQLKAFDDASVEIKRLEGLLNKARQTRKDARYTLWQTIKRVRKGIAANYGEESVEYSQFGGTRTSEHRSRHRPHPLDE